MSWLQIRIDSAANEAGGAEDILLELGAAAVTMEDSADQPIFEPPPGATLLWQATRVTGLFPASSDVTSLLAAIHAAGYDPMHCRGEILEDRDWEREWMENYHPMRFGKRLWVCPSWCEPPEPSAVNLLLDPGLAFGTGTHPTTALCLQWLDSQDLTGATIIDFGCGSGILGIAALLLGAERMIGIDNDPQALIATRANAERNNIAQQRYSVLLPTEVPSDLSAAFVVANILAAPLIMLSGQLLDLLQPGGKLALSGILDSQYEGIRGHYEHAIDFNTPALQDEWVRLDGKLSG
ncbi:MAG: ribosomal protein L11 methyltransferase [Halieaceae bacterium]|jgi:ribosomal protein L11 methyltransferase